MLPGAQRRVVGREQGRPLAAADRDAARLADALSRRPPHRGRLPLSARARAASRSTSRITASLAATRGSSVRRRPTSAAATSATSRSRAATRSAPTATRSTSTTVRRTRASRWRPAASASSCAGSTPSRRDQAIGEATCSHEVVQRALRRTTGRAADSSSRLVPTVDADRHRVPRRTPITNDDQRHVRIRFVEERAQLVRVRRDLGVADHGRPEVESRLIDLHDRFER